FILSYIFFFFFSSRRRHTRSKRDWSSDVCSSDLLIVLLIISNVLQNAAIGNDNSLGGGLLGATVIIVLNYLIAWLTYRHRGLERIVENSPTILVKHGHVLRSNLDRECMSLPELRAALRKEGITTMSEVRYAILEEDGHVTVIPRRATPA